MHLYKYAHTTVISIYFQFYSWLNLFQGLGKDM